MSKAQEHFWETVHALARATRSSRRVDLEAARDALELEQLASAKLASLRSEPVTMAASRRDPAVTTLQPTGQ